MVLGGTGTLIGMVWGGILLVYLPQWSTSLSNGFNLGSGASAYLATIIFGLVLIVAMLAAPNGIQGGLRWLWGHRPRPGAAGRRAASPPDRSRDQGNSRQKEERCQDERGSVRGGPGGREPWWPVPSA